MFKSDMIPLEMKCEIDTFSQFLPTITRKYLFIFYKLQEDNIFLDCKLILQMSPSKYF